MSLHTVHYFVLFQVREYPAFDGESITIQYTVTVVTGHIEVLGDRTEMLARL